MLKRLIGDELDEFLATGLGGKGVPGFIGDTLRGFAGCGDPDKGCLWMRCEKCGRAERVAFRCKMRGVCGSCAARVAHDVSFDLVHRVLPREGYRHLVLSWPFGVANLLAFNGDELKGVERVATAVLAEWLTKGKAGRKTGGILVRHRFGSNLNLLLHCHVLLLDGYYELRDDGELVFVDAPMPGRADLDQLARRMYRRVARYLKRRGIALADDDKSESADVDVEQPRRGWAARRHSLHVYCSHRVRDREELAGLIRYMLRCGVDERRFRKLDDGRYAYRLDKPGAGGALEEVLTGCQVLERIATLIPARGQLTRRYFGVLGSGARWRKRVMPTGTPTRPKPARDGAARTTTRTDWAELLKRVYGLDALLCRRCGVLMKLERIEERAEAPRALKTQAARWGPVSNTEEQ